MELPTSINKDEESNVASPSTWSPWTPGKEIGILVTYAVYVSAVALMCLGIRSLSYPALNGTPYEVAKVRTHVKQLSLTERPMPSNRNWKTVEYLSKAAQSLIDLGISKNRLVERTFHNEVVFLSGTSWPPGDLE
jgi:hypothetical protein